MFYSKVEVAEFRGNVYRAGEYGSYYWRTSARTYSAERWDSGEQAEANLVGYLRALHIVWSGADRSEWGM